MKITYQIKPYSCIGSFTFGMSRDEIQSLLGLPLSTTRYGYPAGDRFLDDYGFFYLLSDNQGLLEAAELYPGYTEDTLVLSCGGKEAVCSTDIRRTIREIGNLTDDLVPDEEDEEESYISAGLGLLITCSEDTVENILIHSRHYYDTF